MRRLKPHLKPNNDQVVNDEDEDEEDEEGEKKQSANHSSRILVEVPVEVRHYFRSPPPHGTHAGGDSNILGQFHGRGSQHWRPLVHPQSCTSS